MRQNRLLYLLLAIYFSFVGGGAYYALSLPIRITHHVIVTILVLLWLRQRWHKGGLPQTPLNLPIFAAIGVWLLATVTSHYPRMSFEHVWLLLTHVWLFYVVYERVRRGYQRQIIELALFMGAIVILLSGIELYLWYQGLGITSVPSLASLPKLSLALSVSTLQAGFTAPLIILSMGWALTTPRRDYRVALLLLSTTLLIVLLLTQSRGGLLSLIVATGSLIILYLSRQALVRRFIAPKWVLGGGVVLGLLGMALFVYLTIPFGVGASNDQRFDMYSSAIEMTRDNPLTGVGVGMFGRVFREYRNPVIAQDKLASAHNLYLNLSSETGVIGIVVGVWLLIVFTRTIYRNWEQSPYRGQQRRVEIAGAALMGMAAHSMVEFFSTTPLVLLILVLGVVAMTPLPKSRLEIMPVTGRTPLLIGVGLTIIYGLAFIPVDYANLLYQQSINAPTSTEALNKVREAQAIDPSLNLYVLHEAHLRGQSGAVAEAIAAYEAALALEPTWDMGWINLGALEEQRGNADEALDYYARAIEIDQRNVTAYINWARLAEDLDIESDDVIIDAYMRGITHQRIYRLPLSEFWYATDLRQEAIQRYVQTTPLDISYRILSVHDPELAEALVPRNPDSWEAWWVIGEHELTQNQDAVTAIRAFSAAITLAPNNGDLYVSRARAYVITDITLAQANLDSAEHLGTRWEYPNAIRATIADHQGNTETARDLRSTALPIITERQEFGATLYNRPAVLDVLQWVRYPGYGGRDIQVWLDVAQSYWDAGQLAEAKRAYAFILQQAPYNSIAQAALDALNADEGL